MRKRIKNRKIFLTALAAAAVLIFGGTLTTLAMMSAVTETKENTFTVGSVRTEIVEEYDSLGKKEPSVKNTGKNDCIVRVRVTVSPSSVEDKIEIGDWGDEWFKADDGFYYYQGILKPGESTQPVFKTYKINMTKEDFIPFDISVYQESVQSVVYDGSGNSLSALDGSGKYVQKNAEEIWNNYKAEKGN